MSEKKEFVGYMELVEELLKRLESLPDEERDRVKAEAGFKLAYSYIFRLAQATGHTIKLQREVADQATDVSRALQKLIGT